MTLEWKRVAIDREEGTDGARTYSVLRTEPTPGRKLYMAWYLPDPQLGPARRRSAELLEASTQLRTVRAACTRHARSLSRQFGEPNTAQVAAS